MNEDMGASAKPNGLGVYRKISEVASRVGAIPKRGVNNYHKYTFMTAQDVFDAVRKCSRDVGLGIFPTSVRVTDVRATAKGTPVFEVAMGIVLVDLETGESVNIDWVSQAMDSEDKGVQKATTSAFKYALIRLFMLSDSDEDPDAAAEASQGQTQVESDWKAFLRSLAPERSQQSVIMDMVKEKGLHVKTVALEAMSEGVDSFDSLVEFIGGYR